MLKEAKMMNGMRLIIILIIIPTLLESPAPNATVNKKIWPTIPMSERRTSSARSATLGDTS